MKGGANMTNEQLVARIKAGEDEAGNMLKLWQQTEGFIAKLAMKYRGCAELEDLKQEGYIGLCEAVRQYDPDKGVPFVNYAAFWIRQTMKRYIDNCCGAIRLSVHAKEWTGKYNRAVREYRKEYGEFPPEAVLCALLGVSQKKLQAIQESARMERISSLSEPIAGEDEELTLYDTLASGEDMEEDAIRKLDAEDMGRELWIAVGELPGNLPRAVTLRYRHGMTLKEVGQSLGVGRGRARQIEAKAIRTLGQRSRGKKYRAYYEQYLAAGPVRHIGVQSFHRTHMSAVEWEILKILEQ